MLKKIRFVLFYIVFIFTPIIPTADIDFFPIILRIEGIGAIGGAGINFNDVIGKKGDLAVGGVGGGVSAGGFQLADLHPISNDFAFDFSVLGLASATIDYTFLRNIAAGDITADDLFKVEASGQVISTGLTYRPIDFFEFRLFDSLTVVNVNKYFNNNGEELVFTELHVKKNSPIHSYGASLKLRILTDSLANPTQGLVAYGSITRSDQGTGVTIDNSAFGASLFVPVYKGLHLTANYHQSDAAIVKTTNNTPTEVDNVLKGQCDVTQSQELQDDCNRLYDRMVEYISKNDTYGTADYLGGQQRLRGFNESRYQGAHMKYGGAEIRYNITFRRPVLGFDAFQPALFHEIGEIYDISHDTNVALPTSTGAGLRLIGDGFVLRLDGAVNNKNGGSWYFTVGNSW